MKTIMFCVTASLLGIAFCPMLFAQDRLVFEPDVKIAQNKHIVIVTGDEEYRSEEWGPMLAKILSHKHGFKTTVLFAIDPDTGVINPNEISNIPGLSALEAADLMILGTRLRKLPAAQLSPILEYLNRAGPIIAIRTATHAFNNDDHFGGYDWQNFGLNVVGENWLNHHGKHKLQGGRSFVEQENRDHPILKHANDFFTWSDIYGVANLNQQQALNQQATVLLRGAVTESLELNSDILSGQINNPMMPLAWLKPYTAPDGGKQGLCFATTAGAAVDFRAEDLRRLIVNASYYLSGIDVPEKADVEPVDRFIPSFYGFQAPDYFLKRKLTVSDFERGHSGRSILSQSDIDLIHKIENTTGSRLKLSKHDSVAIIGNGLAERMLHYGYFESEIYRRHSQKNIRIRNFARPGNTPAFRPHASRNSQWAFPGAETLHPEYAHHSGEGNYPGADEWLTKVEADTILAFFGFNESFDGPSGLEKFRRELRAFIDHSQRQKYNTRSHPELVLISPIAFQDLSEDHNLPNGKEINTNLSLYSKAMAEIAEEKGLKFVDIFTPTQNWFIQFTEKLTVNGAHLNEEGYRRLATLIGDRLFGPASKRTVSELTLTELVREKNFHWFHHYQMPNGVHVDGRRFQPYGPDNYPAELLKTWQLTQNRESEIWALLNNENFNRQDADAKTVSLPPVQTNSPESSKQKYLYGDEALEKFTITPGYKISLFASEQAFPNLANPVQLTFDGKGRLWVAVMPAYPHYKPGDPRPNDKILIYEDTDRDGKADKEIIYADNLHLPIGFELTPEGVYVSQAPNLILLQDSDGDDRADRREIILSGFDTHDTHHAISAFTLDPFGNLILSEGVFLHSNIETAYGPIRAMNGGFYLFEPPTQKLTRIVQTDIPNPWGVAFDRWGQDFFLSTSNPDMHWMLPVSLNTRYGEQTVGTDSLIENEHRVRPTSGLTFISSPHFPKAVQGDFIVNNNIGFLGTKQHSIRDSGAGFESRFRMDLLQSSDPNFRPVDVDFSPDGSLYLVDWHNQLIGHMQHNARDPLRDHAHGRIYRISYPENPLAPITDLNALPAQALWQSLDTPDIHLRARIRRELRRLPPNQLRESMQLWLDNLKKNSTLNEEWLLEALWVSNQYAPDNEIVATLLKAESWQVRAQAVRAIRHRLHNFPDANALLLAAASDPHPRVRLEAVVAASWLGGDKAKRILLQAAQKPVDKWGHQAYLQTARFLGVSLDLKQDDVAGSKKSLPEGLGESWQRGVEIYRREGFCATCHQVDGQGLPAAQFPPLANTDWVTGNPQRLIDIVLNGLSGPIEVNDKHYPGHVPMTQFKGLLTDDEMADVLTYVRNAFGNRATAISAEQVRQVREQTKAKTGFWNAAQLRQKYSD